MSPPWVPLTEEMVDPDPVVQFGRWFEEAAGTVAMPEAVALATADAGGRPSLRMVLLKAFDERGFVFYTNYGSRKGRELEENPRAAMAFYWDPLGRQVRIEGAVERVTAEESDAYFDTRPRGARIGARTSRQSRTVADRRVLEERVVRAGEELGDGAIPRPAWWGGFRLRPAVFEFWQNREDRLHDRLRYSPRGVGWHVDRLEP